MGFFDFGKKGKIVDLSKRVNERHIKEDELNQEEVIFPDSNIVNSEPIDIDYAEDKKKKLAKRIGNMIEKLENLSSKLYHLEQRIEVLEKKLRVNNFEGE
jgi:predicted transcriptional regulator|tara:strand:- start:871 stop:1170 length:300 start_codon:yes stop_codon:yes gene_type:complete